MTTVLELIAELANEGDRVSYDDLHVVLVDTDGNSHDASVEVNSPSRNVVLTVTCDGVCADSERQALLARIEELED